MDYLSHIRAKNPLVLNITNVVVSNFVANGLLALGASPIMSNAKEEMPALTALCQALVINIGTLTRDQVVAMRVAGRRANECGIPVVLDPVGVGASAFRLETVNTLLAEIRFTAIRGNAGEIATLVGAQWQSKGVDAGTGEGDVAEMASSVANRYQCVVVVSGAVDVISDGTRIARVSNGTPLFPRITGSGCLLSAVCGAYLALSKEDHFHALWQACRDYAIAGQRAAQGLRAHQCGQFVVALLDSLAEINPATIKQEEKVDVK
ncbi:hydroxyethylthiazole kinase [Pasteurellaceae bacterium HPA106]|uniref:hydroxyethylthiazole kinase n=1 Tax=Spirabiliibacterium pneumoniae TaxID=221400 RepID=UPI001AAC4CB9|nr:hydroxyethylthiazole kinase [Spirabiliibacterium pneumoniae]MBE2896406.1 hydroxyethylthiazole kinase [Spirabiliibacterium pneumoniae]